jgi:hypothetical protein
MVADIFTKPLPNTKIKKFSQGLGLLPVWGGVLGIKPYSISIAFILFVYSSITLLSFYLLVYIST